MMGSGYFLDKHKRLVSQLYIILTEAAVEYEPSEQGTIDVVNDFTWYIQEWAAAREQGGTE